MYSSPYFVPFLCQMVVMKGLPYHMIAINLPHDCNKLHYSVKFAIFGDKYLSQDLIVILRNMAGCGKWGVGEGG